MTFADVGLEGMEVLVGERLGRVVFVDGELLAAGVEVDFPRFRGHLK